MKRQNHIAMPRRSAARTSLPLALAAAFMLAIPAALHAQRVAVDRVTATIEVDEGVIQQIVDAARVGGVPATPGGAMSIPVSIIKTLALNALYGKILAWIREGQICNAFDKWAVGKQPGDVGTIVIEFVLTKPGEKPTATSPRIVVPMFVKKETNAGARAGKGGGTGYLAPMGPNGAPTMRLDISNDGSCIIERIGCPR